MVAIVADVAVVALVVGSGGGHTCSGPGGWARSILTSYVPAVMSILKVRSGSQSQMFM